MTYRVLIVGSRTQTDVTQVYIQRMGLQTEVSAQDTPEKAYTLLQDGSFDLVVFCTPSRQRGQHYHLVGVLDALVQEVSYGGSCIFIVSDAQEAQFLSSKITIGENQDRMRAILGDHQDTLEMRLRSVARDMLKRPSIQAKGAISFPSAVSSSASR